MTLSPLEAAETLGVSRYRVYELVRRGVLRRIGTRILAEDVERFLVDAPRLPGVYEETEVEPKRWFDFMRI